jgi:hypothetical protein
MTTIILRYLEKLYYKHWVIGLSHADIKEIIKTKTFNQDIKWLSINSADHFNADPFLLRGKDGNLNIFYEDLILDEQYGKIFLMTADESFTKFKTKLLLDTKSHLSYPFIFKEDGRIFVFPEASKSGKLTCYEYDQENQSLHFLKEIINLPLLDSTILKYKNKYWLFGTINGSDSHNKLYLFFSDNLLGPYTAHPGNPVKNSLDSSRPAGNFIEIDEVIYRPSQNCENFYGESLTINKINKLDEDSFAEEPYMFIKINQKNLRKHNIHTIHTINIVDNIIAVDGKKWTFSPLNQWKFHAINRRLLQQSEKNITYKSLNGSEKVW